MVYAYLRKGESRILNGGYAAWRKAKYPREFLEKKLPSQPGNFTVQARGSFMCATMKNVQQSKKDLSLQLWDAREINEWNGSVLKKGASKAGRIPWARSLNWSDFRNKKTKEFLDSQSMKDIIANQGIDKKKKQIFYCQSGVRTTQILFSLYLLGWPEENLLNYDGSWIEWSYHKENEVLKEK